MPTKSRDTIEQDAQYPDSLTGMGWVIDPDRLNGEVLYWDADDPEDQEDLPDGAQYGWWLPVHPAGEPDLARWAAAPRALREAIADLALEPGDAFEVTDVESGEAEHDPYTVEVRRYDGDGGPA